MAKKTVVVPANEPEQEIIVAHAEPTQKDSSAIKQKIEDSLNGKTIITNDDLKEVLQYL